MCCQLSFKLMLKCRVRVYMVKMSRICSFSLCKECTMFFFFSAWLLNMKVFLVIKYNLLGEMTTLVSMIIFTICCDLIPQQPIVPRDKQNPIFSGEDVNFVPGGLRPLPCTVLAGAPLPPCWDAPKVTGAGGGWGKPPSESACDALPLKLDSPPKSVKGKNRSHC